MSEIVEKNKKDANNVKTPRYTKQHSLFFYDNLVMQIKDIHFDFTANVLMNNENVNRMRK